MHSRIFVSVVVFVVLTVLLSAMKAIASSRVDVWLIFSSAVLFVTVSGYLLYLVYRIWLTYFKQRRNT